MQLADVYEIFPTDDDCVSYLEQVRWQGKPRCPYCQKTLTTPLATEPRHHCKICKATFSVTVQTVFHHTHVPLQKWFYAIVIMLNARGTAAKQISSRKLAAQIGTDKDTAWRMITAIDRGMSVQDERDLLVNIAGLELATSIQW